MRAGAPTAIGQQLLSHTTPVVLLFTSYRYVTMNTPRRARTTYKKTCDKCGIVVSANQLKKHQEGTRCVARPSTTESLATELESDSNEKGHPTTVGTELAQSFVQQCTDLDNDSEAGEEQPERKVRSVRSLTRRDWATANLSYSNSLYWYTMRWQRSSLSGAGMSNCGQRLPRTMCKGARQKVRAREREFPHPIINGNI